MNKLKVLTGTVPMSLQELQNIRNRTLSVTLGYRFNLTTKWSQNIPVFFFTEKKWYKNMKKRDQGSVIIFWVDYFEVWEYVSGNQSPYFRWSRGRFQWALFESEILRYGKNMDKEFRNEMIKAAKEYGGSIRQLLRLTGLSYGLIRKVSWLWSN